MITIDTQIVVDQRLDTKSVDNAISEAIKQAAPLIQNEARSNHRYKSHTGNLIRATKVQTTKTLAKAYIDDSMAKYGKYIHDGKGRWAPDPFLDNAIQSNLDKIDSIIANSIDRNLKRNI